MPAAVAVATASELAADAARRCIRAGGNAVDAAIAAALMCMNTEPGVCSFAGGAFITIKAPGETAITIDGYAAIPGVGAQADSATGWRGVRMAYGGGVHTDVGAASVAVPGSPAAIDCAHRQFACLPMPTLMQPTIEAVRDGFPLSQACHTYLQHAASSVFANDPNAVAALHPDGQNLANAGERIVIDGLARTLTQLAHDGLTHFYTGELAMQIVDHLQAHGGIMTRDDLSEYRAIVRPSLVIENGDWQIGLNPPPAIGGSMLAAILGAVAQGDDLLQSTRHALQRRRRELDFSLDLERDAAAMVNE
ncbi:MAG: gamma-glutamyltransferase, partial [Pseudomonadota bacterium]